MPATCDSESSQGETGFHSVCCCARQSRRVYGRYIPLLSYHAGSWRSPPPPTHVWKPGRRAAPARDQVEQVSLLIVKLVTDGTLQSGPSPMFKRVSAALPRCLVCQLPEAAVAGWSKNCCTAHLVSLSDKADNLLVVILVGASLAC